MSRFFSLRLILDLSRVVAQAIASKMPGSS
jgi:hypothetical protein